LDTKLDKNVVLLANLIKVNSSHIVKVPDSIKKKLMSSVWMSDGRVNLAHQLAPAAFPRDVLFKILSHTEDVTKHNNIVSFNHHPSDLFQIAASELL
jgi:hypothetical protein